MSITRRTILLSSAATVVLGPVAAAAMQPASMAVPRRILALYDGAIGASVKDTAVHGLAAMPLEWLGLTVEYYDVRQALPPIWNQSEYRGVLTWFPEPNLQDYASYVAWVERVAAAGLRMVQIGDAGPKPGSMPTATALALRRRLFAAMGIRSLGQWSDVTIGDRVVKRDSAHTEFEYRFDAGLPAYEIYVPSAPDAVSWLVAERADKARSQSHVIMTSRLGGFIAPGYATASDATTGIEQWFVDPFAFLAEAFATADLPAFDTTTLCGRRIFYSHIDGDGWRSISQIRALGRAPATNAEVVLQSVIAANPDLPVTVAPIAAEMDPEFAGDLRAISVARKLFAMPQVEAATHTYTHPFRWEFFEHYSVAAELPFQTSYRSAATGTALIQEKSGSETAHPGCCGRASKSPLSPPRAFGERPFDLDQEVSGSARLIEAIAAGSGKTVRLLQWPGNCRPFPGALQAVLDARLLNINGGDTRCDSEFPSISAVAPLGFQQGGLVQIYSSNSSEELYTDLWTDRYFGFRDLPETWRRTEAPRRLKPVNLYYHMYSGERRASLDALLSNIRVLRERGDVIGLSASGFAALAQGFFTAKLSQVGPSAWHVHDRGNLQTVRFAGGATRMLNLAGSEGVLGERVINGELYVALDPAAPTPLIMLEPRRADPPSTPLLVQSSWQLSAVTAAPHRLSATVQGFGPGFLEWRVPEDGRWHVQAGTEARDVQTGAANTLRIELPDMAVVPIGMTIERMG